MQAQSRVQEHARNSSEMRSLAIVRASGGESAVGGPLEHHCIYGH